MKKTAILALVAAMPVMAGTPAPVATVAPAPAPAASPFSVEVSAIYNFASNDIYPFGKSVDVYGGEVTGVYAIDQNNAATLRFSDAYGSEVLRGFMVDNAHEWNERDRYEVQVMTIMPGYRYSMPVCDQLTAYAGVNMGISRVKVDLSEFGDHENKAKWGFAYSVELGASYKVAENIAVFAAYQFSGNTARPRVGDEKAKAQVYHGLRAGVSFAF